MAMTAFTERKLPSCLAWRGRGGGVGSGGGDGYSGGGVEMVVKGIVDDRLEMVVERVVEEMVRDGGGEIVLDGWWRC